MFGPSSAIRLSKSFRARRGFGRLGRVFPPEGFEPSSLRLKAGCVSGYATEEAACVVGREGFEPPTGNSCLKGYGQAPSAVRPPTHATLFLLSRFRAHLSFRLPRAHLTGGRTSPVHLSKVFFSTPIPGRASPTLTVGVDLFFYGPAVNGWSRRPVRGLSSPAHTRGELDRKQKKPPGVSPGGLVGTIGFREILAAWRSSFAEVRHFRGVVNTLI